MIFLLLDTFKVKIYAQQYTQKTPLKGVQKPPSSISS